MPTPAAAPAALRRPDPMPLDQRAAWSLTDASRATTLSVRTLQNLIADGRIPATKVGRRVLLDPQAVRSALFSAE